MNRIFQMLVLLFSLVGFAANSNQLQIETLMELEIKSGSFVQSKAIPDVILSTIDQYRSHTFLTDEIFDQLREDSKRLFDHEELVKRRRTAITAAISEQEAQLILGWLNSDLGERLTQAEITSDTAPAIEKMYKNKQSLLADKSAIAFANELDEVLASSETSIALGLEDMKRWRSIIAGNTEVKNTLKELSPAVIENLSEQVKENNTLWAIQTYAAFSAEEKNAYLVFLSTDYYQKYAIAGRDASHQYLSEYGDSYINTFFEFLYKDTTQLDEYIVVSYPEGEDLTFQSANESGQKFLMGWTGEEQDFEFVYVKGIPGKLISEEFWTGMTAGIEQTYGKGSFNYVNIGSSKSKWGAEIEYRLIVPEDPEINTIIYFRVFNDRISYLVSVVAFERKEAEKTLHRALNIIKTAKILK